MNLWEDIEQSSAQDVLKKVTQDVLDRELSDDAIAALQSKLGVADMLTINQAYKDNNWENARIMIGKHLDEYAMAGRKDVQSAASTRPKPIKRQAPEKSANVGTKSKSTQTGGTSRSSIKPIAPGDDKDTDAENPLNQTEIDALRKKAGL